MMPIVDAHVCLSQDFYSLQDYLDASTECHVLRMVCVQQPQSKDVADKEDVAVTELRYLQGRATTRGSGGFPHSILASIDIADAELVRRFIAREDFDRVRGISYQLKPDVSSQDIGDYIESIDILSTTDLCLDLQATSKHVDLICEIARRQAQMNIVVTIFNTFSEGSSEAKAEAEAEPNWLKSFAPLAKIENVSIKLCGMPKRASEDSDALGASLIYAIDLFGYERIMFSSGISTRKENSSFDPLWFMYDKACSVLTVRQRNHLLRLNAIRIFDL